MTARLPSIRNSSGPAAGGDSPSDAAWLDLLELTIDSPLAGGCILRLVLMFLPNGQS